VPNYWQIVVMRAKVKLKKMYLHNWIPENFRLNRNCQLYIIIKEFWYQTFPCKRITSFGREQNERSKIVLICDLGTSSIKTHWLYARHVEYYESNPLINKPL